MSIGIVAEDGSTFYAECTTFDERNADEWVWENVLGKLSFWGKLPQKSRHAHSFQASCKGETIHYEVFGSPKYIKEMLMQFFAEDNSSPQFYAYYADYDWVVFCRIFGRMTDLPKGFPMFCIDLKQMMWERCLDEDWKRENHPDPSNEHNALADAEWNKGLYEKIAKYDPIPVR